MAHYFHPIDPFLLSEITERLVKKKKKIIIEATPLLSLNVLTLNRGRVSTLLRPSRVEPVWERLTSGRHPRARDINIFTLKRLVLLNVRNWHRPPLPHWSPLQPSQRTLGQVSEVSKLEQSPSPDRSFSLQGSLEANFIKDQVAGPTQYK